MSPTSMSDAPAGLASCILLENWKFLRSCLSTTSPTRTPPSRARTCAPRTTINAEIGKEEKFGDGTGLAEEGEEDRSQTITSPGASGANMTFPPLLPLRREMRAIAE